MNLILAIIWFFLGASLLVNAWSDPASPLGPMPAFVALALCGYNLVRWWAIRQLRAAQKTEPVSPLRRRDRPAAELDHLFKLEDEPIHLPPPETAIQASPPSPGPQNPPGSQGIKE